MHFTRITDTFDLHNFMKRNILICICLLIGINVLGQDIPEKLYLHIDRTCFSAGETIWFRGYLPESNYIYVELLGEDVIERVKVKRSEDGFAGSMVLPDSLNAGNYVLRAYTRYQMNYPDDCLFRSRIYVYDSEDALTEEKHHSTVVGKIDVSFYPEGGRYFAGRKALVGFKVMEENGNYVDFTGELINSAGETLVPVGTIYDGMGTITFIPEEGEQYYLRIMDGLTAEEEKYPLPPVSQQGGTLNVFPHNSGSYIVSAYYVSKTDEDLKIILNNNDYLIEIGEMEARNSHPVTKTITISEERLSPGINHILMLNKESEIISERMFFIYADSTQTPVLDLSFDKKVYSPREKFSAKVSLKDGNDNPVQGDFSVSIVNGIFGEYQQEDNILSYMELTSELKGRINHPTYYFDSSVPLNQRKRDIDLLMFIQGWRYYDIQADSSALYEMEFTQSLSGKMDGKGGKNSPPKSVVLVAPQQQFSLMTEVKKGESFSFTNLDFCDSTFFYALYELKGGGNIVWNKEEFAPWDKAKEAALFSEPPVHLSIPTYREANHFLYDTIRAVTISAQSPIYRHEGGSMSLSPMGQNVFDRRAVRERKDMEKYDYDSAIDYILRNFSIGTKSTIDFEERIISNRPSSIQKAKTDVDSSEIIDSEEPLLYIDGVRQENTGVLKGLSVRDVETMVVLRGNEGALYNTVQGVILIELRRGGRPQSTPATKLSQRISTPYFPLGYQTPTKFYSPIYDTQSERASFIPDMRNTIYWNPSIKTDSLGRASFDFYTSDYEGGVLFIRIEGLTDMKEPLSVKAEVLK